MARRPLVVKDFNPNRMFILNLSDNIKTEECILSYNGVIYIGHGPIDRRFVVRQIHHKNP